MVTLKALVDYTNTLLSADSFADYCPNGLQVEGRAEVARLVSGVTASQALIDAAIEKAPASRPAMPETTIVRVSEVAPATRSKAASKPAGSFTISTPTLLPELFSLITRGKPSSAAALSRVGLGLAGAVEAKRRACEVHHAVALKADA